MPMTTALPPKAPRLVGRRLAAVQRGALVETDALAPTTAAQRRGTPRIPLLSRGGQGPHTPGALLRAGLASAVLTLAPAVGRGAELQTAAASAPSRTEQPAGLEPLDLRPGDGLHTAWSTALSSLGCEAGVLEIAGATQREAPTAALPAATGRLSRYEAAALLLHCLGSRSAQTDLERRVEQELQAELTLLRQRQALQEQRLDWLEAVRFSPTTRLKGRVDAYLGGTEYTGNWRGSNAGQGSKALQNGTSAVYRFSLDLSSSITGKDLLFTRLRTGNFEQSAFAGADAYVPLAQLDDATNSRNILLVDRIWYQLPVGNWMFFLAPRAENFNMISSPPTIYGRGDYLLKIFKHQGAPGVYGTSGGTGFGAWWRSTMKSDRPALGISANYVARTGNNGDPRLGGLFTGQGEGKAIAQVAYGTKRWQVSSGFGATQARMTMGIGTPQGGAVVPVGGSATSWALNGFWQPPSSGWLPSINLGFEQSWYQLAPGTAAGTRNRSTSWMVGLEWTDVLAAGNELGFAVGGPQSVSGEVGGLVPNDGGVALELWYSLQLTDRITLTPGVFYLSRPFGQLTGSGANFGGTGTSSFGTIGALIKSTIRF